MGSGRSDIIHWILFPERIGKAIENWGLRERTMSDQDGRYEKRRDDPAAGGATGQSALPSNIEALLETLVGRLAAAERRQEEVFGELSGRIEKLTSRPEARQSEAPQSEPPSQHNDVFNRAAAAMADVAKQFAAPAPVSQQHEQVAPQGYPDLNIPSAPKASTAPHTRYDPSDSSTETTSGDPDEPWDRSSAEALTRAYETGVAGIAYDTAPRYEPGVPAYMSTPSHAAMTAYQASAVPQQAEPVAKGLAEMDRSWLDERFAEVAERVERIFGEFRSEEPFEALGDRFSELEARFASAVEDLAKRSDVAGLGEVEACISEMAEQLEKTHRELARVSEIETQVRELAGQVSTERLSTLIKPQAPAIDTVAIADAVAEQLAEKAPSPQPEQPSGVGAADIEEIKKLVQAMIRDRQTEGEHTASVLDTMQQAMIRLLDRMDALEDARSGRTAPASYAPPSHGGSASGASGRPSDPNVEPSRPGDAGQDAGAGQPRMATAPTMIEENTPSLADYAPPPRGASEADEDGDEPDEESGRGEGKDRRQFMEAARRAAQQANDRARNMVTRTSGNKKRASGEPSLDDADVDAVPRKKAARASNRLRIIIVAFAIIAAGLGATKLLLSRTNPTKQSLSTPVTQKRDMLGQNSTTTTTGKVAGRALTTPQAGGVTITTPTSNGSEAVRQDQNPQYAAWVAGAGVKLPTVETVPASLVPSTNDETTAPPVTSNPSAKRSTALPNALIGPLSLRLAAANGDPSAEFEVGARFAEGKGPEQDFKQAITWYRRAATSGFVLAQYRLATLYERGLGVTKDLGRAKIWYHRAATQGNVKAMHNLAVLTSGADGNKPDYGDAAHWFEEAAERDLADSQFNLAILYQSGLGVNRDVIKAYTWFGIAARSGDKIAAQRKAEIAKELKPEDIARADQAIAAWRSKSTSRLANDPRYAGEQWKQRANTNN